MWSGGFNSMSFLTGCMWPNSTPEPFLLETASGDGWNPST
uniref:Uncharacterized protein n=1 Tax=Anguilla anguilla TaxID=7936 RepID=A0A0E9UTU1_ANGAN